MDCGDGAARALDFTAGLSCSFVLSLRGSAISPRSTARRSVLGLRPEKAEASVKFTQPSDWRRAASDESARLLR